MEPVVSIRSLSVAHGETAILDEVDLSFERGVLTVLIGPSGSGKSTLLRSVNRLNDLYPQLRTTGRVEIRTSGGTTDVYAPSTALPLLRRRVAMVFQSPNVLPTSIRRNFSLPLRHVRDLRGREMEHRMQSALEEVELWDDVRSRLKEPAETLSGGQQQRLCLARALALEPEILLLDEPTASLDFAATRRIERLLDRLKERYAVLAVSHSLGQTSRLADRCAVLNQGRIVEHFGKDRLHDPLRLQALAEELF